MDWVCVNMPFFFVFWAHYTLWPVLSDIKLCLSLENACAYNSGSTRLENSHLCWQLLPWNGMAGNVTYQHAHARIDWETFALRSILGLETKRHHFAVISDIRIQAVVFLQLGREKTFESPLLMYAFLLLVWGKIAISNFLWSVLAKRLCIFQISCLWKVPFSHKYYFG